MRRTTMRPMRRLLAVLFFIAAPAFAQYDELLRAALDQWHVPAVAVAVVQNDKIVYLKAMGVKEIGKPGPVTPDTLFEIGSITKQFTAAAILLLQERGQLSVQDPIGAYLTD